MKSYRDLAVWQRSFELAKAIYKIAEKLPAQEKFGLASQVKRSSVSIPSNLSEGQQRDSAKEFTHFISIARGSCAEMTTQLELIAAIYKIDCHKEIQEAEEISKMLYKLKGSIRN